MKPYCLYKHERCFDVAIQPLRKYFISEKNGYKVKIMWWWVTDPTSPKRSGFQETVFIKLEDINKWKELDCVV